MKKKITILKPAAASIKLKHKDKLNLMSVQLGAPLKQRRHRRLPVWPLPLPSSLMRTGKHKSSYTRRQISNIFSIVLMTLFSLGVRGLIKLCDTTWEHPLKRLFQLPYDTHQHSLTCGYRVCRFHIIVANFL